MKTTKYISLVCALAINSAAFDLDTIQIESSTIDDKFNAKMLEVSSTTTIQGAEVEEYHADNMADVLNKIPGLTVRENEGDSNKIHIRGIATEMYMGEKPGVAIVIDGVPVQERAGSINIDSDNIESIKIIKGGASYLYGNDAIGGAVVITTKKPKGKNEGFITTEQGSYGYEKYVARLMGSTEDFAVEVQGSYKASDGYWENSDYWAKSFNGKFQYYIDDSSDITVGLDKSTRFENDTGSITHTVDGVNQVETNPTSIGEVGYGTMYDIDLSKYFVTYSKYFENDSNLMVQLYQYEDTTVNRNAAFDGIPNNGLLRDDHLYDAYANTLQQGLKSEYRLDGETLASMIGIDVASNESKGSKTDRVTTTYRRTDYVTGTLRSKTNSVEDIYAVYGEAKYRFSKKLVASVNARVDQIEYDYTNELTSDKWNTDFTEPSFRLGGTYELEKNSAIYTNVSTGFRVPTLSQMYAGDMETSTRLGTFFNNTDIDTEKTYNYEVGYRGKNNPFSYEVSVFQLDRKDVIGKSSGNYAGTRGVDINYDNMADIQNRGLELSLSSDRSKELSFIFNYTYLDSKYDNYDEFYKVLNEGGVIDQNGDGDTRDDYVEGVYDVSGNDVPRVSKHTFYIEGNYRPIKDLVLTADMSYRSSQYADDLNEVKVDGYSVYNIRAKYGMKISGIDVEVFGKIDNLFDKQYYMMPRVTGDRNDDNLYDVGDMGLTVNPGILYLAGLSAKF